MLSHTKPKYFNFLVHIFIDRFLLYLIYLYTLTFALFWFTIWNHFLKYCTSVKCTYFYKSNKQVIVWITFTMYYIRGCENQKISIYYTIWRCFSICVNNKSHYIYIYIIILIYLLIFQYSFALLYNFVVQKRCNKSVG